MKRKRMLAFIIAITMFMGCNHNYKKTYATEDKTHQISVEMDQVVMDEKSSETTTQISTSETAVHNDISTTETSTQNNTEATSTTQTSTDVATTTQYTQAISTTSNGMVASIQMASSNITIKENVRKMIKVSVTPSDARNKNLRWSSSDETVAKVSNLGLVTALKPGITTITVSSTDGSNVSSSCEVQVENQLVIVLDPGHGNHDSGAVNRRLGLKESEINMKIAKACRDYLEQYDNVSVFMTRSTDKGFLGLVNRTTYAKAADADVFISMHINSTGYGGSTGAYVYVTRYTGGVKYHAAMNQLGKKILTQISKLGIKNRGTLTRRSANLRYADGSRADYYAVIRNSTYRKIPSLLIEHGFIDSSDSRYMNSSAKCKKLGVADAKAIVAHYGLKKRNSNPIVDSTTTTEETTQDVITQLSVDQSSTNDEVDWTMDSEFAMYAVTALKLNVNGETLNLCKNQKFTLKATVAPSIASNKKVSFESSQPAVVSVNANGVLQGKKRGSSIISCYAQDGSGVYQTLNVKVK